jgi:hypothetical protein
MKTSSMCKVSSPCLRQEAGLTNMTLVNTYHGYRTVRKSAMGYEDLKVERWDAPWSDQKMCCC